MVRFCVDIQGIVVWLVERFVKSGLQVEADVEVINTFEITFNFEIQVVVFKEVYYIFPYFVILMAIMVSKNG